MNKKTQQFTTVSMQDQFLSCIAIATKNISEDKDPGANRRKYAEPLNELKSNKHVMDCLNDVSENKHISAKTVEKISQLIWLDIAVWKLTPKHELIAITRPHNVQMYKTAKVVYIYESRFGYALVSNLEAFLQQFACAHCDAPFATRSNQLQHQAKCKRNENNVLTPEQRDQVEYTKYAKNFKQSGRFNTYEFIQSKFKKEFAIDLPNLINTYFATFDIESALIRPEAENNDSASIRYCQLHKPVSIGGWSNVDQHQSYWTLCENGTDDFVLQFVRYLNSEAEQMSVLNRAKYTDVFERLEDFIEHAEFTWQKKRFENLRAQFTRLIDTLCVVGFNSAGLCI